MRIGAQFYTIRDYCTNLIDFSESLKKIADIGYEFVHVGKMMDMIKGGMDANEAMKKAMGTYGRVQDAARMIDPRHE